MAAKTSSSNRSGAKKPRRPYVPKNGGTLTDTLMASNRGPIEKNDADLLIIPALAQIAILADGGSISTESFTMMNETNCVIHSLSTLIYGGARCDDDDVLNELRRICQNAINCAERSAFELTAMAESYKVTGELRASAEQVEVMKRALHVIHDLIPLSNLGGFYTAMREAKKMIESAKGVR